MIQRIQSIFLLLSAGVLGSNFVFPFASSSNKDQIHFEDGLFTVQDNPYLLGLVITSALITFIIIFLYKNRQLQLKLSLLSFLLLGACMGLLFSTLPKFIDYSLGLGVYTPVIALVLTILAYVFIKKDDKLVKSMDRLR